MALLLAALLGVLLPLPNWGRTAPVFTRLPEQTLILPTPSWAFSGQGSS